MKNKIGNCLFTLLMLLLMSCSSNESDKSSTSSFTFPETPLAKKYKIFDKEEFPGPPGKKRMRILIYSDLAKTFEERAQTAMFAAKKYQKSSRAYEVQVWMEALPSRSSRVAIADYYPYGVSAWGNAQDYSLKVEASSAIVTGEAIKGLVMNMKTYFEK